MSTDIYSIYKVTNKINGKCYVGFDSKWPNRQKDHLRCAKHTRSYSYKFSRALRKYNKENFDWEVIYQSQDKEHTLKVMEPYFINEYDSFMAGYNMTLGGEGWTGRHHTEENKIMIRKRETDRAADPEYKKLHIEKTKMGVKKWFERMTEEELIVFKLQSAAPHKGLPKSIKQKERMSLSRLKYFQNHPNAIQQLSEIQKTIHNTPEMLEYHRKTLLNNPMNDGIPEHNPRALEWRFTSPLGETFDVRGRFKHFCKNNNLPAGTMYKGFRTGKWPIAGRCVGWRVKQVMVSENT